MLDFGSTIEPGSGLAETYEVLPPNPPQDPLWRTLVRLLDHRGGDHRGQAPGLTPFVVGAYGHSRRDCVTRGVGEAVERFALIPPGGDDPVAAATGGLDAGGIDYWAADVAMVSPEAATGDLLWRRGTRLDDGTDVAVPAGLVDYPYPAAEARWFDPGPSGAASGADRQAALRSALLEVIERDAFLLAWDCGLALGEVSAADLEDFQPVNAADRPAARALRSLLARCRELGLRVRVARVPTDVEWVFCAAAFLEDLQRSTGRLITVGCNATDSVPEAVLGAVQESLQLRSVALNLLPEPDASEPPSVDGENARLQRISSRAGAADIARWLSTFRPCPDPYAGVQPCAVEDLAAAVAADGCRPVVVDLGARLPPSIRAQGWAVVKVIPVGYQPLRIDERLEWSWNEPRRRRVVERARQSGMSVLRPEGGGPPHPLP